MKPILDQSFWDCICLLNETQPIRHKECEICGTQAENAPTSQASEVDYEKWYSTTWDAEHAEMLDRHENSDHTAIPFLDFITNEFVTSTNKSEDDPSLWVFLFAMNLPNGRH